MEARVLTLLVMSEIAPRLRVWLSFEGELAWGFPSDALCAESVA